MTVNTLPPVANVGTKDHKRRRASTGLVRMEKLESVLGNGQHQQKYLPGWASISQLIVLPQPRQTFERIAELGTDLALKGQLNNLIVARFRSKQAKKYLEVINMLWGTDFRLEQFADFKVVESGDRSPWYYILIAGQRRFEGFRYAWYNGCLDCQERYGTEGNGFCIERHRRIRKDPLTGDKLEVKFCIDITPLSALFIQLSENTHMQVPAHEEAKAYFQLFQLIREVRPKYPISLFAREVGRAADTVRQYIRFCELPTEIQEAVENETIRFGIAVEISRIIEEDGEQSQSWRYWLDKALLSSLTVPDFRALVSEYIQVKRSGQRSLFEIMGENQEAQIERQNRRLVVQAEFLKALHAFIGYFGKVKNLYEEGKLGQEDSPFSELSPIRLFRKLIERQEELLPFLREGIPGQPYTKIAGHLFEIQLLLNLLENEVIEEEEAVA